MLKDLSIKLQQTQTHRNYKYKRLSRSDSEDELGNETQTEMLELQNRGARAKPENPNASVKLLEYDTLFERPIMQGESLASISLKYRISVADLKRVNRLHKETEFYALNSLKIPVKSNSVLYELLQEERSNEKEQSYGSLAPLGRSMSSGSELESEVDIPVGVISISQICREKQTRKEARQFLMNMQKDLKSLQEKTNTYKGSLDEAAATLTNITFPPMGKRVFGCSDLDLSWWKVLIIGGIIIVGVPFTYLLIFST